MEAVAPKGATTSSIGLCSPVGLSRPMLGGGERGSLGLGVLHRATELLDEPRVFMMLTGVTKGSRNVLHSSDAQSVAEGESEPPRIARSAWSPQEGIRREQAVIDAIDEEIISLVEQRQDRCRAVRRARQAELRSHTNLARENAVLTQYHTRLGETGTALALALLKACHGYT
ncbi:hypothetical protein [Streptomyces chartreusis]|uniref:hypothetical protein n=1 Tax=Streptomyces chartreusis TaxID=1969 RepID=UPI002E171C39